MATFPLIPHRHRPRAELLPPREPQVDPLRTEGVALRKRTVDGMGQQPSLSSNPRSPSQVFLSGTVGEQKTNMIRWPAVALRTCTVSFVGPSGVRHAVQVTAESVYEGAALGVSALRNSGCDRAGNRAGDSGARAGHLSPADRPPNSTLVWRHRRQPWRDAEEAQVEAAVEV